LKFVSLTANVILELVIAPGFGVKHKGLFRFE